MGINIRQKGQEGEREVAKLLNGIIVEVMRELEFPEEQIAAAATTVQRNQNQSAVGGNDLNNCLGLSIEVKRQEQLSVGTWWQQTLKAAERNNEMPVLIYRQNRKPWRIRTFAWINLPDGKHIRAVVEFDKDTFIEWFRAWARAALLAGEIVRS